MSFLTSDTNSKSISMKTIFLYLNYVNYSSDCNLNTQPWKKIFRSFWTKQCLKLELKILRIIKYWRIKILTISLGCTYPRILLLRFAWWLLRENWSAKTKIGSLVHLFLTNSQFKIALKNFTSLLTAIWYGKGCVDRKLKITSSPKKYLLA